MYKRQVFLQCGQQFNTTDRIYVWAIKPAYYHCRTSSTTVYGVQSGLSAEADECVPPVEVVAFGALTALARRELSTISQATQSAIAMQGPRWAATFKRLMREWWETETDAHQDMKPVLDFGPDGARLNRRATGSTMWV